MPSKQPGRTQPLTGAQIRQGFLDYFRERGHTIVPSMSLVPGGDQTLLFTNSGMVQFKDVFLGTGTRPYNRVADSQKCLRVAGKHNDLDDVGRDNSHHTFFEMLGNWSFGDYYKKEAIAWAWDLLTGVWGLPRAQLWATCFEDERGEIPRDDEAAEIWAAQPGIDPAQILFFGRKDNFWEMAETGPCGPDSEVHIDLGPKACSKQGLAEHTCHVNGDCGRFLELWNLVFIQYNRGSPADLQPLPAKHVDTGMGFDRIVSILQGVDSNYQTDLFTPLFRRIQEMAGHSDAEREALLTPYRVISDHARAATFLIGDGVVPGNIGRNYVCRMIIRRASRFGNKAGFHEPFLAGVAEAVMETYGEVYPEIRLNRGAILQTLTDEEGRFQRTVDTGVAHLVEKLEALKASGRPTLDGPSASGLYTTYGLPLEITRDIAREQGLDVDEAGFQAAMESHRLASTGGPSMGEAIEADVDTYQRILSELQSRGQLGLEGVAYDPYEGLEAEGVILSLLRGSGSVDHAEEGDDVAVILPETHFYVESGGQVSDTGTVVSVGEPRWLIDVREVRRPIAGLIVHVGRVISGEPAVGDLAVSAVDAGRRWDIMRNHTATHLLHASLREVLGEHARQAGSLVAPDRLRFDFTHPEAMTPAQIERVEGMVNEAILANYELDIRVKPRDEAVAEGAMALFGETYGDSVRTISIGARQRISYELCGGTHVPETGVIGPFVIVSEGSVASGIRRIEAVTGRGALALIHSRLRSLGQVASRLGTSLEGVESRVEQLLADRDRLEHEMAKARSEVAGAGYASLRPRQVSGVTVLSGLIPDADADTLRGLADRFRQDHPSGVILLGSVHGGKPVIIAAVSQDWIAHGLHAGEMVKAVAQTVGGSGGGKPTLAQAGGKDPGQLPAALEMVDSWITSHLR